MNRGLWHLFALRPAITPLMYFGMILAFSAALIMSSVRLAELAEENGQLKQLLLDHQDINRILMKHIKPESNPPADPDNLKF